MAQRFGAVGRGGAGDEPLTCPPLYVMGPTRVQFFLGGGLLRRPALALPGQGGQDSATGLEPGGRRAEGWCRDAAACLPSCCSG